MQMSSCNLDSVQILEKHPNKEKHLWKGKGKIKNIAAIERKNREDAVSEFFATMSPQDYFYFPPDSFSSTEVNRNDFSVEKKEVTYSFNIIEDSQNYDVNGTFSRE